jgi:hypothetical protein
MIVTLEDVSLGISVVALFIASLAWRLANRSARNDVIAQVRDWGGEVVQVITDAASLCEPGYMQTNCPGTATKLPDLTSRASALIERGRFFFPNAKREAYGTHKSPAKRGIRPQVLDLVLISYELTRSIDPDAANDRLLLAFRALRDAFVSTIQKSTRFSLTPSLRRYEQHLEKITVEDLPTEILDLVNQRHNYELKFNPGLKLDRYR